MHPKLPAHEELCPGRELGCASEALSQGPKGATMNMVS